MLSCPAVSATVAPFREYGREYTTQIYLENGDVCDVVLDRLSRSDIGDESFFRGTYDCDYRSYSTAIYGISATHDSLSDEVLILHNYYNSMERILIERGYTFADTGSYINLRQWAGMDAPVLNTAYPGDRVTVWLKSSLAIPGMKWLSMLLIV